MSLTDERGNPMRAAGRFHVGTDGGFSPEQYADMALARMFESAKNYPEPLKTRVLEEKFKIRAILEHYFAEAMADERRRIGKKFEDGDIAGARLLLPVSAMQPARS